MQKIYQTLALISFFALMPINEVRATSLDNLYRDVIRSDNKGYLPMFVTNRQTPQSDINDQAFAKATAIEDSASSSTNLEAVNLTNNLTQKASQKKEFKLRWKKALEAVAQNRVTPLDLEEIRFHVQLRDSKATEVLAWMYTNGIGVKTDFSKAFILYNQAEQLGAPNAKKNAALVYKILSREQKAALKTSSNLKIENL